MGLGIIVQYGLQREIVGLDSPRNYQKDMAVRLRALCEQFGLLATVANGPAVSARILEF